MLLRVKFGPIDLSRLFTPQGNRSTPFWGDSSTKKILGRGPNIVLGRSCQDPGERGSARANGFEAGFGHILMRCSVEQCTNLLTREQVV